MLGIQQNKVFTRVKRIGGGFGGKESRGASLALPLVVAAKKLNRPLRVMLDRDEDILVSGGRHPFYFKYKVAFDDNGKILGVDVEIYSNCGYSVDLSYAVSKYVTLTNQLFYLVHYKLYDRCFFVLNL